MARRSKAREMAVQLLYQSDVNPDVVPRIVREMIDNKFSDQTLRDFAWRLYAGVMEFRATLDQQIESVAENWSLGRMAPTDRNVLRLGAFELVHTDTPHRIAIDEAIELARKFGTAQSPQFVNGILDQLVPDEKREDARQADEDNV